jgi:hypothetical protein
MIIRGLIICCVLLVSICYSSFLFAQEKNQSRFCPVVAPEPLSFH